MKSVILEALSHIIRHSKKNIKIFLSIATIFSLLSTFLWLTTPIIFKVIIDKVDVFNMNTLVYLVLIYTLSRTLIEIFSSCQTIFLSKFTALCSENFSVNTFSNLIYQDSDFHCNHKTGEVTKILDRGVNAISEICTHLTISIIPTIFRTIALFIYLFFKARSTIYSFIIIGIIILYSIYTFIITERRRNTLTNLKSSENSMNQVACDSLMNYENVKIFNNEKLEIKKYSHFIKKYCKEYIIDKKILCLLNIGQNIIMSLGIAICLFLSINDFKNGIFTLGDIMLINTYILQIYMPLSYLGVLYREIKNKLFDIEQMLKYTFIKNDNISNTDNIEEKNFVVTHGEVTFQNVSFGYNDTNKECINNMSFNIKPKKFNAIIGETGSGKSSILKLVLQLYRPKNGHILIDGQNTARFSEHAVREHISFVSQDIVLFNDTIKQNLLYANPEYNDDEIFNICRIVNLHNMIEALPRKYDSIVGERGVKLSGGEKQRISIARALMKKSKIFIFDEATSALDSKTELIIQNEISKICKGATLIVVAHRLSTIKHAEQIIVIDKGMVAETGNSHTEMLKKKGYYYKMWDAQNSTDKKNVN